MKRTFKVLGIIALVALIGFALAGCGDADSGDPTSPGGFVAVTDITNVPTTGTLGTAVSLSGATVVPATATNQSIVWGVKTSGAGVTSITGTSFTPTSAGTVTLTATIANGAAEGTPYTKDFPINITAGGGFVAVTDITNVPTTGTFGTAFSLSGATVVPATATDQSIVWSITIRDYGTEQIIGTSFELDFLGTQTLTATIANGTAVGTPYTKDFLITITGDGGFVPVTDITNIPLGVQLRFGVDLSHATVVPATATNRSIVWSVKTPGAGVITDNIYNTTTAEIVTLTATIAHGTAAGTPYSKDFTIDIVDIDATPSTELVADQWDERYITSRMGYTFLFYAVAGTTYQIAWSGIPYPGYAIVSASGAGIVPFENEQNSPQTVTASSNGYVTITTRGGTGTSNGDLRIKYSIN